MSSTSPNPPRPPPLPLQTVFPQDRPRPPSSTASTPKSVSPRTTRAKHGASATNAPASVHDPLLSRLTPTTITKMSDQDFLPGEKEVGVWAASASEKIDNWLREVENWETATFWVKNDGEGFRVPERGTAGRRKRRKVDLSNASTMLYSHGATSPGSRREDGRKGLPVARKLFADAANSKVGGNGASGAGVPTLHLDKKTKEAISMSQIDQLLSPTTTPIMVKRLDLDLSGIHTPNTPSRMYGQGTPLSPFSPGAFDKKIKRRSLQVGTNFANGAIGGNGNMGTPTALKRQTFDFTQNRTVAATVAGAYRPNSSPSKPLPPGHENGNPFLGVNNGNSNQMLPPPPTSHPSSSTTPQSPILEPATDSETDFAQTSESELDTNDNEESDSDSESHTKKEGQEFQGSLTTSTLNYISTRVGAISYDLMQLDIEELKLRVLHFKSQQIDEQGNGRMSDSLAIITATTLQLLPPLHRLWHLLEIWGVRVEVCRVVPPYLGNLDKAERMINHAMNKSDMVEREKGDEGGEGERWLEEIEEGVPAENVNEMTLETLENGVDEVWEKRKKEVVDLVGVCGQIIDGMLDLLEGREETVPEEWIDRLEVVEAAMEGWIFREVNRAEALKRRWREIIRQRKLEQERRRREEVERLRREELDRRQREMEAERLRKEEEERLRLLAEEERLRKEEEERLRKEAEAERLRQEEAERLRLEEEDRIRKEEAKRLRLEEEERLRKAEEEYIRQVEEQERLRIEAEEERLRQEENERLRLEIEELQRKDEEERQRQLVENELSLRLAEEEAARRKAEEQRIREIEERMMRKYEEMERAEEEARKQAEAAEIASRNVTSDAEPDHLTEGTVLAPGDTTLDSEVLPETASSTKEVPLETTEQHPLQSSMPTVADELPADRESPVLALDAISEQIEPQPALEVIEASIAAEVPEDTNLQSSPRSAPENIVVVEAVEAVEAKISEESCIAEQTTTPEVQEEQQLVQLKESNAIPEDQVAPQTSLDSSRREAEINSDGNIIEILPSISEGLEEEEEEEENPILSLKTSEEDHPSSTALVPESNELTKLHLPPQMQIPALSPIAEERQTPMLDLIGPLQAVESVQEEKMLGMIENEHMDNVHTDRSTEVVETFQLNTDALPGAEFSILPTVVSETLVIPFEQELSPVLPVITEPTTKSALISEHQDASTNVADLQEQTSRESIPEDTVEEEIESIDTTNIALESTDKGSEIDLSPVVEQAEDVQPYDVAEPHTKDTLDDSVSSQGTKDASPEAPSAELPLAEQNITQLVSEEESHRLDTTHISPQELPTAEVSSHEESAGPLLPVAEEPRRSIDSEVFTVSPLQTPSKPGKKEVNGSPLQLDIGQKLGRPISPVLRLPEPLPTVQIQAATPIEGSLENIGADTLIVTELEKQAQQEVDVDGDIAVVVSNIDPKEPAQTPNGAEIYAAAGVNDPTIDTEEPVVNIEDAVPESGTSKISSVQLSLAKTASSPQDATLESAPKSPLREPAVKVSPFLAPVETIDDYVSDVDDSDVATVADDEELQAELRRERFGEDLSFVPDTQAIIPANAEAIIKTPHTPRIVRASPSPSPSSTKETKQDSKKAGRDLVKGLGLGGVPTKTADEAPSVPSTQAPTKPPGPSKLSSPFHLNTRDLVQPGSQPTDDSFDSTANRNSGLEQSFNSFQSLEVARELTTPLSPTGSVIIRRINDSFGQSFNSVLSDDTIPDFTSPSLDRVKDWTETETVPDTPVIMEEDEEVSPIKEEFDEKQFRYSTSSSSMDFRLEDPEFEAMKGKAPDNWKSDSRQRDERDSWKMPAPALPRPRKSSVSSIGSNSTSGGSSRTSDTSSRPARAQPQSSHVRRVSSIPTIAPPRPQVQKEGITRERNNSLSHARRYSYVSHVPSRMEEPKARQHTRVNSRGDSRAGSRAESRTESRPGSRMSAIPRKVSASQLPKLGPPKVPQRMSSFEKTDPNYVKKRRSSASISSSLRDITPKATARDTKNAPSRSSSRIASLSSLRGQSSRQSLRGLPSPSASNDPMSPTFETTLRGQGSTQSLRSYHQHSNQASSHRQQPQQTTHHTSSPTYDPAQKIKVVKRKTHMVSSKPQIRVPPAADRDDDLNSPLSPLEFPSLRPVLNPPSTPMKGKELEDRLEKKINKILIGLPSLTMTPSPMKKMVPPPINTAMEHPGRQPKFGESKLPIARTPSTPTIGQAPNLTLSSKRTISQPGEVKMYHLHKSDEESPVKLFVRLVGDRGERVMVRVGGGWADLKEYLIEYASHHGIQGPRKMASEGFVEFGEDARSIRASGSNSSLRSSFRGSQRGSPTPTFSNSRPSSPLTGFKLPVPGTSRGNTPGRSESPFMNRRPESPGGRAQMGGSPGFRYGLQNPQTQQQSRASPGAPNYDRPVTPGSAGLHPSYASPTYNAGLSANFRRPTSRLSFGDFQDNTEASPSSPVMPSVPLGLAGPKSRNLEISAEKKAWVDGMLGQVRKASAERSVRLGLPRMGSASNLQGREDDEGNNNSGIGTVGTGSGPRLSDMGKVGGTRRMYATKPGSFLGIQKGGKNSSSSLRVSEGGREGDSGGKGGWKA
ncbi:hypothetical protein AA313_de0209703 [Arthrobotrys entomopaga]|nr:hypothetical protein AA313_de0209703 [Arthrobotrys entomopaga]